MNLDQVILDFFISHRIDRLSSFFLVVTFLGSLTAISGLTFVCLVYFWAKKQLTRVLPLLISVCGSASTVFVLKQIFFRSRPSTGFLYLETGSSLPSGHAAMAMALYGFLIFLIWKSDWFRLKKLFLVLLSVLIVIIGVSRLYLGVHYFSDVLAGYSIGLVWVLFSQLVLRSKIWPLRGGQRPL